MRASRISNTAEVAVDVSTTTWIDTRPAAAPNTVELNVPNVTGYSHVAPGCGVCQRPLLLSVTGLSMYPFTRALARHLDRSANSAGVRTLFPCFGSPSLSRTTGGRL